MSDIAQWSATAGGNNAAAPNGFPENMPPSGVNDAAREVMAAVRRQHEDAQWIDLGHAPAFLSANSFTVEGDVTAQYRVGRRIRCSDAGTLHGWITASSYSSPSTTVTVRLDAGALTGSLAAVALGMLLPDGANHVLPAVPGLWVPISIQTASNSPSLEVTDLTGFDNIRVTCINFVPSDDQAELLLRVSTGGSFKSGATDYSWARKANTEGNSDSDSASANDDGIQLANQVGANGPESTSAIATIFSVRSPNVHKHVHVHQSYLSGATALVGGVGSGRYKGSGDAIDGVQVAFDTGAIAIGTFLVEAQRLG